MVMAPSKLGAITRCCSVLNKGLRFIREAYDGIGVNDTSACGVPGYRANLERCQPPVLGSLPANR